uniref:Uncharacterized protein n=1 Tax=Rhizophora mucronata TaxID=61149 RepID=A0A2P2N6U6_RHIMU
MIKILNLHALIFITLMHITYTTPLILVQLFTAFCNRSF